MWPDVFLVKRLKGQGDKEKVKESAFHLLWLQEKGDARSLDVGRYRGHRGSKKPKQSVTWGDICKRDNRGKLSNWRVLIRTSTPRRGSWGSYIPTVLKRGNRPEKCIEFMQNNVCVTQRNEDSPAAWQWSQRECESAKRTGHLWWRHKVMAAWTFLCISGWRHRSALAEPGALCVLPPYSLKAQGCALSHSEYNPI